MTPDRGHAREGAGTALDPRIAEYYARLPEESRLTQGAGQLEFARTCELIERLAPAPPAVVLDARCLDRGDATVDLLLLLGPLYHLADSPDRARALAESFRVLRPGGLVLAAGISRFASALDGLSRGLLADPAFAGIIAENLATGRHRNDTGRLDWFTTAYFHHPEELAREVETAGFRLEGLLGLGGPIWLLADFDRRWADPAERERLLQLARALEAEPTLLGASAHLLVAVRKPG